MSEALKSVGAVTLFVGDLPAARSFYERVFGRTAAFEDDNSAVFKFDNTLINLVLTSHNTNRVPTVPGALTSSA